MKVNRISIICMLLLCRAGFAEASVIQGAFSGVIGSTGQQITGHFSYDTGLAPVDYCATTLDGCYDYLTSTDTWMQIVFTVDGVDYAMSDLDGSTLGGGGSYTEQARVTPAPGFEGGGDRWSIVDFDLSSTVQSRGFLYLYANQLFDTDALTSEFNWNSAMPGAGGYGEFEYVKLLSGQRTFAHFTLNELSVSTLDVAPVPLPASAWLLLFGFGGLGMFARKRKA